MHAKNTLHKVKMYAYVYTQQHCLIMYIHMHTKNRIATICPEGFNYTLNKNTCKTRI